jgi:hypothetical protein
MAKKRKIANTSGQSKDLWIAPRYSLKGPANERAWKSRPGGVPNSGRFLELADIALGLRKPGPDTKKTRTSSTHGKKRPSRMRPNEQGSFTHCG